MEPSGRWEHIDDLFARVLDRAPGERAAFLKEACDDEDVRQAVEALLSAGADDFLETPLMERSGALLDAFIFEGAPPPSFEGQRAGPYRLVREIGRGGMGVVYLAERADGCFEQQVAVKLLRPGPTADDLARRFAQERQILASLQHPNIARLYDGGVTEDGLPYLAMERIEGQPLDAYCETEGCSFKERLRLFLTATRAVQHAHQRLIIHRDLKPSNILVTEGGEVKLLDFGLAKLLEESVEGKPAAYPTQRWMTLQYASPEQVREEALTTASDTYQLGLILYELLTGQRPYDVQSKSPGEAERTICETEPPRPSTAVTEAAAEAMQCAAGRLQRKLRGDLDTIVLKALHKDPARGYASAETLADDLEHHLEGRPISARPDTFGYRARKFVQRHRVGVTAAALVLLSLLMGLAGTVWQAQRAADEARRATAERDKAEQVTAFLVDVFEVAEPSAARGDTVTARELLARGAARVRSELTSQPEVRATMMHTLGRVHRQLGLYDEARPLFEDALDLRRNRLATPHPDIAESLHELGVLFRQMGEAAQAADLLDEALAMRRQLFAAPHPALTASLTERGLAARDAQDLTHAETLLREALAVQQVLHGDGHPRTADARFNLAAALHDRGDYADARMLFEEAVAAYRARPDELTLEYAASLNNLAVFHSAKREYAAAGSLHQEALGVQRALYGDAHPSVGQSFHDLALMHQRQGRGAVAESLYREALSIQRAWYGGDHPDLAVTLADLGSTLTERGAYDEAEALLREAEAMDRRLHGDAHWSTAGSLQALARLLRERGRPEEAEPLFREAAAAYREAFGAGHPLEATTQVELGALLRDRGDHAQAEPLLRTALASLREALRADHERIAHARGVLGACLTATGDYEEAEQHLMDSYAIYRALGHGAERRRAALDRLAALYEAWGKSDEAARYAALRRDS